MPITLSSSAAKQITNQLAKRGKGIGLLVGVKTVGCSGFAYTFDYAEGIRPGDEAFEADGARVVVASADMTYLDGSRVDYVKEGLKQMFKIDNPNVDATCGCGESFNLKSAATSA